ncbi:hypothetical protein CGJ30_22130 [Vibrio parahaemolyticus]|nr:hypothetical protein CGK00_23610 [Vibrio parahaemolyticus]TOF11475.1 hypothetical protein CGJ30_22130 [Vibrio parahaemolyticus]
MASSSVQVVSFLVQKSKSSATGFVGSLLKMPFESIESANMPTTIFAISSSSMWQLSSMNFCGWPVFNQSS